MRSLREMGGVYWKVLYPLFDIMDILKQGREKQKQKKNILTFLGQDTEETREELRSRVMNI